MSTKMKENFFEINDPYQAAYLWQFTNEKPILKLKNDNLVTFIFLSGREIQNALKMFSEEGGSPNIKDFINRYKLLRNEMYLLKGAKPRG